MSGPSVRDYKKQPDCEWWPDAKPTTDITGKRNGRLVAEHPVYAMRRAGSSGRVWYWLSTCDCTKEVIHCNTTQSRSCGCLRIDGINALNLKRRRKAEKEGRGLKKNDTTHRIPEKRMRFDRLATCNRLPYQCRHYSTCQDERIDTGKHSARYMPNGGCYTPGMDEARLADGIVATIRT